MFLYGFPGKATESALAHSRAVNITKYNQILNQSASEKRIICGIILNMYIITLKNWP
jgi:hypothetical protein